MSCGRCGQEHQLCEACGQPSPTCRRYRCHSCWRLLCNWCAEGEDVLPRERLIYCASRNDTGGTPAAESCFEHGVGFLAALRLFSTSIAGRITRKTGRR